MEQKRPNQRPKKLDTQGVRGLLFALAVSTTIGFWAIVSRIDAAQSIGAENPDQVSSEPPLVQEENQLVVDLPPIPTLVPTLDTSNLVAGSGLPTPQTIDLVKANPPLITIPGAGGQSSERGVKEPAKPKKSRGNGNVTKTRSSK